MTHFGDPTDMATKLDFLRQQRGARQARARREAWKCQRVGAESFGNPDLNQRLSSEPCPINYIMEERVSELRRRIEGQRGLLRIGLPFEAAQKKSALHIGI